MTTPQLPPDHPAVKMGKIGILILNLGTPEATDYWSMRRYLKQFLSDRRVIEVNPVLWWGILNGVILNIRPSRSAKAYEKIWNKALNESPLKTITRAQSDKLSEAFSGSPQIMVDWGMRYGQPDAKARLQALKQAGCDRILLFPLYPQYSASTTATALDVCYDMLKTMRWQPAIRTVPPYYEEDVYISALAQSLRDHLRTLDWQPDMILASFHGLPKSYLLKGDPYYCHCHKTTRLLRAKLNLPEDRLQLVFQSRFGKSEWLQPYAQGVVEGLPAKGVKKLTIIMPGFASDCLETLEEVGIGLGETFHQSGGEKFSTVACLNDSQVSITMLEKIIRKEIGGWL